MCGIAGYIQKASDSPDYLRPMLDKIARRGPDGEGREIFHHQSWEIHLGHRRLAIIDLAGGAQPMFNEDRQIAIAFNGEIYNFQSLRDPLIEVGHQFHTRSDTETIIHHFEEFGPRGFNDLNGMFAFGIWNQTEGTLTLARDRAGIKPLYYAHLSDDSLIFSSELTSLLEHRKVARQISPEGVSSLFFRDYAHAPATMIRGVRKLPAGCYLTWRDGKISAPKCFVQENRCITTGITESHYKSLLINQLEESVRSNLVADVPVGVFLSGGIDSSIVAAMATRVRGEPVSTFSIGFEEPEFDESIYAQQVATFIKSDHHHQRFCEADLIGVMDVALQSLDEPIADPSILPTFLVSKLASQHVKVVLGGDGGDELFGGYPTYKAYRMAGLYSRIPRIIREHVIGSTVRRMRTSHGYQRLEWKAKRFVNRWEDDCYQRHQHWMSNACVAELLEAMPDQPPPWVDYPELSENPDELNSILEYDFRTYLPGSVLTKVDRASMYHGLEVRPPLLDNRMIELARSVPSSIKVKGKTTKWLLKQAAVGLIPDTIIHRKKKGFGIPLSRWVSTVLSSRIRSILNDSPAWSLGLLQPQTCKRWMDEHVENRVDHSRSLWALLVLDDWLRRVGV